jgi:uncharacterized protein (TIGR02757 family)
MDSDLKAFLDEKANQYNNPDFIETDPIQLPHRYRLKEDIEIAGFLTATIAWGKRSMIIKSGERMLQWMGDSPYDFVMDHSSDQLNSLSGAVHRTFQAEDLVYFVQALRHIYCQYGGLEKVFSDKQSSGFLQGAIHHFKHVFFELPHPARTTKHIGDPFSGSAAKRLNMFLRWMVRRDNRGVDFGLWESLSPADLSCPLDVHSGNVARKLSLLQRKQNDAKAVMELDTALRQLDPVDPVKYDFALFGLGVFEGF